MIVYQLSPRLYPTKEQLDAVEKDMTRICQQLEMISNEVATSLINSSMEKERSLTKYRRKKKEKTSKADAANQEDDNSTKSKEETIKDSIVNSDSIDDDDSKRHQTLEVILQHKIRSTTMDDDDDDDDDDTWVEVKKRSNQTNKGDRASFVTSRVYEMSTTKTRSMSSCSNHSSECNDNDNITIEKDATSRKKNNSIHLGPQTLSTIKQTDSSEARKSNFKSSSEISDQQSFSDENKPSVLPNHLDQQRSSPPQSSSIFTSSNNVTTQCCPTCGGGNTVKTTTTTKDDIDSSTKSDKSTATIHQLEQRISELEQSLAGTNQKHQKEQRKEKEKYDDLIQSLQLRLYISETRLKTYEDALEKHIQAVADNTSGTSLPPQSPIRRSMNNSRVAATSTSKASNDYELADDDDCIPSPTLISRVVQQQQQQQQKS
jgi:hypothetical protein